MATATTENTGTLSNEAKEVAPAAIGRRLLIVANNSDAAMIVRFGAVASAAAGVPLAAGTALAFLDSRAVPAGAVSLFCAGASKSFTVYTA